MESMFGTLNIGLVWFGSVFFRSVRFCMYSYVFKIVGFCRFWPNNNSRMYVLENTGKLSSKSLPNKA